MDRPSPSKTSAFRCVCAREIMHGKGEGAGWVGG